MSYRVITARVTDAKRLLNTGSGNPRWRLTMEVGDQVERYLTQPDAAVAHDVSPATLPRRYEIALEDEQIVRMREFVPLRPGVSREDLAGKLTPSASVSEPLAPLEAPACVTCGLSSDDPAEGRRIEDSEFCEFHRREDLAGQVARLVEDAADLVKAAEHFERLDPALRAPVAVAQALVALIHPDRVL